MVMTSDQAAPTGLEGAIFRARKILETDLEKVLEGRFGIHGSGRVEAETALRLTPRELADRREVEGALGHFAADGDPAGAVERLLREASFTHLNRLVAIRIAESVGMIPPALAEGRSSRGFQEILEIAPALGNDQWGGYWQYLQMCGDELASDAPILFNPRNPLLTVAPSVSALDELVEILSAPHLAGHWAAADTLGWAYQFFNSAEERKAIKDASLAPRSSYELAVLNQFFTPRYVVDFLVQNTVGRRLLETGERSDLVDHIPLLVGPPLAERASQKLEHFRILDPACGSGHFLLGAYDLLETAWEIEGSTPAEAAPHILASLWGVDIDARCAQVASAALIFRARQSCPRGVLPQPNIITARPLPEDAAVWDRVMSTLGPEHRQLVEAMRDSLLMAPLLGPLLKVDQQLEAALRRTTPELAGGDEGLFPQVDQAAAIAESEAEVLKALSSIAISTQASAGDRLFSAEGQDAIRFIEAMQQRYDVVLMNPPFGAEVPITSNYLQSAYGPDGAHVDLYAAFVCRALSLLLDGGYVGAITSRTGLFLRSFETWRRKTILGGGLATLVDLGQGVMEQAMVEAAAYVLANHSERTESPIVIRLLTSDSRGADLARATRRIASGTSEASTFKPDLEHILRVPGAPFAYWADGESLSILSAHDAFEPKHGLVRNGLTTGDDFRFVRAWWEVGSAELTTVPELANGLSAREQLSAGKRWAPIVKGGASQPWFSPLTLVIDWENDGERLRNFVDGTGRRRSVIRSTQLYFRPGFSWTRRAPRLIPYVVPAGCIPSVSRYQAFPVFDVYSTVGVVGSNVASAFCRLYGEKFLWPNFLTDTMKALPVPDLSEGIIKDLATIVEQGVTAGRERAGGIEPLREFVAPSPDLPALNWDPRSLLGTPLEDRVAAAYGLSSDQAAYLEVDMREALAAQNWSADPSDGEEDEGRALAAQGSYGERLVSYLVGVAFGRWDVRIGRDPSLAPKRPDAFAELAACPPGALVDGAGLPCLAPPPGYPIDLPDGHLLLDENGSNLDIEAATLRALNAYTDDAERLLQVMLTDLGYRDLQTYLRRRFFRDHLSRYSSGRRKAPIYWQLGLASRQWGVWVYSPFFSRETLFAISAHATRRLAVAKETLGFRRAEGRRGASTDRATESELALLETLIADLTRFTEEAQRVAELGWEPDLDDGVLLCAAPLADLFPAWRDLQRERTRLRTGSYEWAAVSTWSSQL